MLQIMKAIASNLSSIAEALKHTENELKYFLMGLNQV